MTGKYLPLLLGLLLSISLTSAAVFFDPPRPILTIRDPTTGMQYTGKVLGFANTGTTTTETDGGINLYEEGTVSGTDLDTSLPFTITDLNGAPNDPTNPNLLTEVTTAFDVWTGNTWISGTGYSLAMIFDIALLGGNMENGIGGTTTTYSPYFNHQGTIVGTNRYYADARILRTRTTHSTTPLGTNLYSIFQYGEQDGNIIAFESDHPGIINTVMTLTPGTPCSTLYPPPSFIPLLTPSECVFLSQYASYIDLSQVNWNNEGAVTIIPSPAGLQQTPNVYESDVDLSNARYLSRATNIAGPGTTNMDIAVLDIQTYTDQFVPEVNPTSPMVQAKPTIAYPWVAFIEAPTFPVPSGTLYMYNFQQSSRTNPLAQNVYLPKITFDGTQGIITWTQSQPGNAIYYLTFSASGLTSAPQLVPMPQTTSVDTVSLDNLAVVFVNGDSYIYYVIDIAPGAATSNEVWRYDINTGTNTPIYTPPSSIILPDSIKVNYDNTLLTLRVINYANLNSFQRSLILNIDQADCTSFPCDIYDAGSFTRTTNGMITPVVDSVFTLPKSTPSNFAGLLGYDDFSVIDVRGIN